ncbi:MAG: GNAT family N-acetyltransferase [Pseudomonadota bacterium]
MIHLLHLESAAEAERLLRLLRNALNDESFAYRLKEAEAQGYKVVAAYSDDRMVGALGYRITCDLFWGKTLYVDDLIVDPAHRAKGVGASLLTEVRQLATSSCDHLRLCSGLNRSDAHRFYETNGMAKFSYQFIEALKG